jgi:hypothetical protein
MKGFRVLSILVLATACGFAPEKVSLSDPEVQELLEARDRVDTAAMGFTPIEKPTNVRLERAQGSYDRMLHIHDRTARTISFRATPDGWRWTGEQEIHRGPKKYEHPDGIFFESITITYELEPISGHSLDQVNVSYAGEDARLTGRRLTLAEVEPVLREWRGVEGRSD